MAKMVPHRYRHGIWTSATALAAAGRCTYVLAYLNGQS